MIIILNNLSTDAMVCRDERTYRHAQRAGRTLAHRNALFLFTREEPTTAMGQIQSLRKVAVGFVAAARRPRGSEESASPPSPVFSKG
jgi:hypothetical protein